MNSVFVIQTFGLEGLFEIHSSPGLALYNARKLAKIQPKTWKKEMKELDKLRDGNRVSFYNDDNSVRVEVSKDSIIHEVLKDEKKDIT